MGTSITVLQDVQEVFKENKMQILQQWVSYEKPSAILELHSIGGNYFLKKYASGVFDYFMGVISGDVAIGDCPVMQKLLTYFKKREISADELFEICSHFRRAMVDFSYDAKLNSKELFDAISYIFDENFKGILKFYTDTMFQKLIDARQEALRASQAKEYFLSNMSHEIRTPLNAILGFVNLLLDENVSDKQRNYLDIIHSSGENLLSIINDILDFSKLRSGEFTVEQKYFSIHEELSHTIELFVASANIKSITLSAFIDPRIPHELFGDSLRIKQIVSNFLSNAVKFTPEHGLIQVEALYDDANLIIAVKDSGRGISTLDKERIFKAFAQAEYGDASHEGGTGLGLSISNQLAQKMSGEITLVSDLGYGSTFTLRVPLKATEKKNPYFDNVDEFRALKMALYSKENILSYKHDAFLRYAQVFDMNVTLVHDLNKEYDVCIFVYDGDTEEIDEEVEKGEKKFIALMSQEYDTYDSCENVSSVVFPLFCSKLFIAFNTLLHNSSSKGHEQNIIKKYKGHILVAEDNEANQELIKIILTKYGLSFDIAQNGAEALHMFKKGSYDLILMDEQMPIMSGKESVQKIIAYEEAHGLVHTPISALTANVIKGAKERGLLSGFDAFLGKPIVLKELEKVFGLYLKEDTLQEFLDTPKIADAEEEIVGLDTEKLMKELMLSKEELLMLLKLFLQKMQDVLPTLQSAIENQEFTLMAKLAHNIKGSSGNFRIKSLQRLAHEMEKKAKQGDTTFDYLASLKEITKIVHSIEIQ